MMTMQLQMYRSEMNFSDIDAADFDSDLDMTGSARPALDEVRSLCGLSEDMMDDMRDMVLY
jgi:hypothetical protein